MQIDKEQLIKSLNGLINQIGKDEIKVLDIKHKRNRKNMSYNITFNIQITKEIEEFKKHVITFPPLKG
jgi:hypothetical protein